MFRKFAMVSLFFATLAIVAVPSAFAERQLIRFKTNAPLEVPGMVIGPGSYVISNVGTGDNSGPLEIQKANGQGLGEWIVEPVQRLQPVEHTVVKLEKEPSSPDRIKYFIPGGSGYGWEFMYPTSNQRLTSVASNSNHTKLDRTNG